MSYAQISITYPVYLDASRFMGLVSCSKDKQLTAKALRKG